MTSAKNCIGKPAAATRPWTSGFGLLVAAVHVPLWAALPTPVAPSTAPPAGDWIGLIQGYIKDGGLVLGLAIAVLGFLWIAYLGFAKFNEARQGKAEWAEVGVLGVVGAILQMSSGVFAVNIVVGIVHAAGGFTSGENADAESVGEGVLNEYALPIAMI